MRIGIIGLGYVGLTLGIVAAAKGIDVYGVESNQYIKDCLSDNRAHFFEVGLNNLIKRYNNKTFHVVDTFPVAPESDLTFDAFIITVGTPLKKIDGKKQDEPSFESIISCLESNLKGLYDGSQLIVLRSTVSVGTTRNIVRPYLAGLCGGPESDILVSMCPERTIEGNAIYELSNLPQIISGNNQKSLEIAQRLFRLITPCVVEAKSLEEAELIKLYCNTYRDITFAIGNVFCMAAQYFGVDGVSAITHANYGYSRSNIANPGFVAGPCLEKDAYILINNMPECESKKFIMEARKFNESLEDMVVRWVVEKVGEPSDDKIIALSGMAFKGQPETSDLRGSSSVYIAEKLKAVGYKMNLHDYSAQTEELESLSLGTVYHDLRDACLNARVLLVLNNHKKYGSVMDNPVFHYSRDSFEILDSWGACTELHYCHNIRISTLGNMFISNSDEENNSK